MKRGRKDAKGMKFRRAASLVTTFEQNGIVLQNFLTRERFSCSAECLEFLAKLDDWCPAKRLFELLPGVDRVSIANQIPKLVSAGVLIVYGTPEAEQDERYRHEWLWGESAGLFHFSIRDTQFVTGKRARRFLRVRTAWRRSPKLIQSNTGRTGIRLPATDLQREPFALMRRRRSRRGFSKAAVPLSALADCLFAGNGIVDFRTDVDYGRLPIAMTPSGGARNPFELYVYARNVADLGMGFYHYDSLKRDLGLVRFGAVKVPEMLGTQKWTARAAAIVFLVAYFPRSMWKYHMPMAYRVVAMEAGFIGQNICLAATYHGLSAVPSGALNDTLIEGYLGLPSIESAVLLTLSIGKPKTQLP